MTRQAAAVLALGLLTTPIAAEAEEAVVMLNVHNARCELCPLIVKAALSRVKGVALVEVGKPNDAGDMNANVVFDNAVTTTAALIKATTDHGYPAQAGMEMTTAAVAKMKPMQKAPSK
jgi:mercuric ion binding protein